MPSNTAAWLTAAKVTPFEIKPSNLGVPLKDEILIKNHAFAVNPVDGKMQHSGRFPLVYPIILGQDVAGEVIALGPEVTRFKIGDRVIGCTAGMVTKRDEERAFQEYTVLQNSLASNIPDGMKFQDAVVLPLGLATAASALFNENCLAMQMPTEPAQESTGKTILIWGGASSVGSCAIQLAVAAGYEVITTASSKNFEYVTKLGASQVFDYNSPTVISDLVDAFKGKTSVGVFDAVAAWKGSVDVIRKIEGSKCVITTVPGFPDPPEGIKMIQTQALTVAGSGVGKAVFEDFLPKALESRSLVPAPEALIKGKGLESLQEAVDFQLTGTSAKKVVVLM